MSVQICPNCGHKNVASAETCVNCDAPLTAEEDGLLDAAETRPLKEDAKDKEADEAYDDEAYDVETSVQTRHVKTDIEDSEIRAGRLRMGGDILLTEQKTQTQFHIYHHQLDEVIIGRTDPETGFVPTIDLSTVDGQQQGVSRRHATMQLREDLLVIIDHHSVNGTYLNGQRLAPEQPRVVRDSDMIRLGRVSLLVTYQRK